MSKSIGFKIRTRLSWEALDNILSQYCRKHYQIIFDGIDSTGTIPRKIMLLFFDDPEDRDRVRHVFSVRGALPAGQNVPQAQTA